MSSHRLITAALVIAVSSGVATRAEAQIGGLLKKARTSIAGTPAASPPTFDATVLELDPTRLAAVVTGVRTAQAQTGPNGASAATLQARAGQAFERRDSILQGRDQALTRYQESEVAVANCVRLFHDSLNAQRQNEMPKLLQKLGGYTGQGVQEIQALAMEMGRKIAAGDTVGALALRDRINAKMGIDPKADSTRAIAKCGTPPPKPAWLAEAEALLEQANGALAAARNLEEQSQAAGARAAGMDARQYAMALERIEAFVQSKGKPGLPWKFSSTELAALSARMAELQGLGFE